MADCLAEEYRKIKRPFPPTPARGEPVRPAPAAGQPGRQPAGHRPAPQGTDRTGGWWRAAGAAGTARGGLLQTTLGDCFKSLRQNLLQRCRRCGGAHCAVSRRWSPGLLWLPPGPRRRRPARGAGRVRDGRGDGHLAPAPGTGVGYSARGAPGYPHRAFPRFLEALKVLVAASKVYYAMNCSPINRGEYLWLAINHVQYGTDVAGQAARRGYGAD